MHTSTESSSRPTRNANQLTYGKKPTKAMPLSANHLLYSNMCDDVGHGEGSAKAGETTFKHDSQRSNDIEIWRHGASSPKVVKSKTRTCHHRKPAKRKLPVNALVLVDSREVLDDPYFAAHTQSTLISSDPISSSAQRSQRIQSSEDSQPNPQTTIALVNSPSSKTRWHKSRQQHKSLPRVQQQVSLCPTLGDGFNTSERVIHLAIRVKHIGRRNMPFGRYVPALTVQGGPLPDVDFGHFGTPSNEQSDIHGQCESHVDSWRTTLESQQNMPCDTTQSTSLIRQAEEDLIQAQLSSISAPRREYSISDADEEEDDLLQPAEDDNLPDMADLEAGADFEGHEANHDEWISEEDAGDVTSAVSCEDDEWQSEDASSICSDEGVRQSKYFAGDTLWLQDQKPWTQHRDHQQIVLPTTSTIHVLGSEQEVPETSPQRHELSFFH